MASSEGPSVPPAASASQAGGNHGDQVPASGNHGKQLQADGNHGNQVHDKWWIRCQGALKIGDQQLKSYFISTAEKLAKSSGMQYKVQIFTTSQLLSLSNINTKNIPHIQSQMADKVLED